MRLGSTLLVPLCSLICVSNGAPPREVGKKTNFGYPYTQEEDQFIVNQLQNILDHTIRPQSKDVWETIEKEHHERKIQGTTGFLHDRSAQSLRHRFIEVLKHNKPNTTTHVPRSLIQKFDKAIKNTYTKEEDNFIIEELSKPSYTHVFSQSTYESLRAKHAIKRAARIPGFEHVRTSGSFCKRLVGLKNSGQFPKDITEKIRTRGKGASSSRSTTSNQETDMQVTNEEPCDDNWIADMITELQNTDFEIDFSKLH